MREQDLGKLDEGDSLMAGPQMDTELALSVVHSGNAMLERLRELFRSSKREQRFSGGLDERKLRTFYLIDSRSLAEILGDEP